MNEDRRSVSTMNYRDKWLFFGGPPNLVEPRVISRYLEELDKSEVFKSITSPTKETNTIVFFYCKKIKHAK